jgi:hypothetical protein
MKRFIERFAIVIVSVTVGFGAKAQKAGDMAAGVNMVVGFDNEFTNVGIGAKLLLHKKNREL